MTKQFVIEGVKEAVGPEEWQVRTELAACYRMMAHHGWDDWVYTHISARVPGTDHFLINPFGLMFEEVTASNLVKIDMDGNKVMDNPWPVNKAGFVIHSAVHAGDPNAHCVIHLHTDYGIAVSNLKDGLLPMFQTAIIGWAIVGYHDFQGLAVRDEEKESLAADLEGKKALLLRNHGTLSVGASVGEAYQWMYLLERACKAQILSQSTGLPITPVTEEAIQNTINDAMSVPDESVEGFKPFDAVMRKVDRINPGYRD